ncbi:MAG: hypothetical protein LBD14_07070 [Puniceicoccales bacterium]|jgi:predicted DNA-binding protein|nr:hypothetical protein [Puniceicoccales bacterium]
MLTLDIHPALERRFREVAEARGLSPEALNVQLIEEAVEDAIDIARCQKILADIDSGKSRVYSAEEVKLALGIPV